MAPRIISSRSSGQPRSGHPTMTWPLRPIRFFKQRSVARKMVNDPASGVTQPEFRNLLGGVALRTRNVTRLHQQPATPPAPNAGTTTVRPARKRVVRR